MNMSQKKKKKKKKKHPQEYIYPTLLSHSVCDSSSIFKQNGTGRQISEEIAEAWSRVHITAWEFEGNIRPTNWTEEDSWVELETEQDEM